MKTLNTLKTALLLVIIAGMFASCSKDDIELVEDGNGPQIELDLITDADRVNLTDNTDYSDHKLILPLGDIVDVQLNISDMGGISKVEVRTVRSEVIDGVITSDNIIPETNTEGSYLTTTFLNPASHNDIVEINVDGSWEITPAIPLYLMPFDRDLLIIATDESGNTSELRIYVSFSHDGEIAIQFI